MPLHPSTQIRLETQLDTLFFLVENLGERQLRKALIPGKWTILEQVAHLARYQEIFVQRLDRIMYEELPGLPAYSAEKDFGWVIWQDAGWHSIQAHLREKRQQIIELVKSYSPKQLKRMGYHPRFGAMDVQRWTEFFLLHEAHHLYGILRMKQEFLE